MIKNVIIPFVFAWLAGSLFGLGFVELLKVILDIFYGIRL